MMLPDQVGTRVVRSLRRMDPAIPIIAISGMMASGHFDELLELAPRVECMAKPLLPAALFAAVQRGLAATRTTQPGESSTAAAPPSLGALSTAKS
jgi:CheY-like chemotaxis protein